jgi:phage terminase large subunit-like protein
MARPRSAPSLVVNREAEEREIVSYYQQLIAHARPPEDLRWEPIRIGPTWDWSEGDGWALPEHTLGWDVLAWTGQWLRNAAKRAPWQYTAEQARFLLWFYAVDETGQFTFHSAALQRLKGWGKDPLAASLVPTSMCGPVQFSHFDGDRAVGHDDPNAWVDVVAVSLEQTVNTMKLLPGMISPEARKQYGFSPGKRQVWAMGDTRHCRAVTASPLALEGGRPTLIIRNETQNWNGSNGGHEMSGVIEGNAAKRDEDSPARILDIFNAYRPGEDSVAERLREAWQATQGNLDSDDDDDRPKFFDFGLMYDSLEAPPEAPLTIEAAPEVLEAIRGDAVWLPVKRLIKSITNPLNAPSESRRKWYNQITGAEDAWMTPQGWDPLARPDVKVESGESVVLFLDCSLSDDATALVGCRVTDGHVFTVGMWQRPSRLSDEERRRWQVSREKVDAAVKAAFDRYKVVAFWGDPSHVLEQETGTRYWDGLFDEWHRRYKTKLHLWAVTGRDKGHAVMWDMAIQANQREFVAAVAQAEADIESKSFSHDADGRLRQHVLNARRTPTKVGMSIAKVHRESRKKIDLAVCMVGARMVRRLYLNTRQKKGGRTW